MCNQSIHFQEQPGNRPAAGVPVNDIKRIISYFPYFETMKISVILFAHGNRKINRYFNA
jgi:hypothetical protein